MPINQITTPTEIRNSGSLEADIRRGLSGNRTFWVDLDVFNAGTGLPAFGDAWSVAYPNLLLVNMKAKEIEANQVEIFCTYSTDGSYSDTFYERSMEFGAEMLDTTRGMMWEDTNTPVDIAVPTLMPQCDYTLRMKQTTCANATIWDAVGKVNTYTFHGAASGTLLFLGASIQESYAQDGTLRDVSVQYKFQKKQRDWNEVWASPRQKMLKGIPQFYQTTKPAEANYSSDTTKDSTPVYVDGIDGTGRWTKPYYMSDDAVPVKKYRYDYCDFGTDLGLTLMDGDGAPPEA